MTKKGRRPVYYLRGEHIPKKYKGDRYGFDKDGRLIDLNTKKKLLRNAGTVDKPRMKAINGQAIYNGSVSMFSRDIMIKQIKEWFTDNIPAGYPIFRDSVAIRYYLEAPRDDSDWDLDNRMMPYIKAFQDVIVDLGIVHDDRIKYIKSYSVHFKYGSGHNLKIKITDEIFR
ncbi:MAG: hypothetical protein ACXABY_06485 [Candidatus Thorarchaeota archaeon]